MLSGQWLTEFLSEQCSFSFHVQLQQIKLSNRLACDNDYFLITCLWLLSESAGKPQHWTERFLTGSGEFTLSLMLVYVFFLFTKWMLLSSGECLGTFMFFPTCGKILCWQWHRSSSNSFLSWLCEVSGVESTRENDLRDKTRLGHELCVVGTTLALTVYQVIRAHEEM